MATRLFTRLNDFVLNNTLALKAYINKICDEVETQYDSLTTQLALIAAAQATGDSALAELDAIANDDLLTISEKMGPLLRLYTDLESRYADLYSRATTLSVSTTALTTARTNWQSYLTGLSPAWNDLSGDTTLLVNFLADKAFPTGWSTSSATTAASGIYTTVTDSASVARGTISRSNSQTAGAKQYSAHILVKKDSTAASTRTARLEIVSSGGTGKTGGINIDTSLGTTGGSSNLNASGVYDLGDDWLLYITMTTAANDTSVLLRFSPAFNASLTSTSATNSTTGSVTVRSPIIALGAASKLGRFYMAGLLATYSAAMTAVLKAISQVDGATSIVIDPISDVRVYADSAGTVKTGELPRDIGITASNGSTSVTTAGTWSRTATTGVTCTIGSATGILNITALSVNEALVPISFVYSGVTRTGNVHIVRIDDAASTAGSGGTGTVATTTTLGTTTGTSYDTTNAVSTVLTVTAGAAGKVQCTAPIGFKRSSSSAGLTGAYGKWQWRVPAGTWADITTEVASSADAETVADPGDPVIRLSGSISVTHTKTGLTNGSSYEFRFVWRRTNTSGTSSDIYRVTGTMTADGTVA